MIELLLLILPGAKMPKEIGVKRITHMLSKAIGRDMHAHFAAFW